MKKNNKIFAVLLIFGLFGFMCKKSTGPEQNSPPVITNIIPSKTHVNFSDSVSVQVVAYDSDGDSLKFEWSSSCGYIYNIDQPTAKWIAPDTSSIANITVRVSDGQGGRAVDSTHIFVNNQKPVISEFYVQKTNVLLGNSIKLFCDAYDPDGDDITITWSATGGSFSESEGDSTRWTAPNENETVTISVTVMDEHNSKTVRQAEINVYQELGSLWICDTFNNAIVKLSPIL